MQLDVKAMPANKVALSAGGGTGAQLSTDAYDAGVARDLGKGTPLMMWAQIQDADAAGGTSVILELVAADDAALSTNLVVVTATQSVLLAALVRGYQFALGSVPPGTKKQFWGFRMQRTGVFTGAATWSAGFVFDKQTAFTQGGQP